ncbi:MAG TPA: DUF5715 family protein [Longimicrobiaceae bacterium]|nr:DUF5715 family protein [Longimicrobiaceae bacterium]
MPKSFSPLLLTMALCAVAPAHAQSLRGSPASVDRMYHQALANDLHFFDTSAGVRRAADDGDLVRLSGNRDYRLADVSYAYVLPSTRLFVQRFAAQYRQACGERLVVTSGIRPRSIRLLNSVARSVHPTGMAVDLRKPRGGRCLAWVRESLTEMEGRGIIEATEEHRPPHFHVAVFPGRYTRYVHGSAPGSRTVATSAKAVARETTTGTPGRRYTVRAGDSIWSIARKEKVSEARLRSANHLRSSRIVVGQVLVIPEDG